jgi:hypothetical protein
MALTMYDSINATGIPGSAAVVAGYGDGEFLWPSSWWDLFPAAVHLVIVVSADHAGDILDVEKGDATPDQVPGWVRRFNRPGRRRPTVYCSRDTWPQVVAALEAAGLSAAAVDWWAATLDETQDVAGAVAVQYRDVGPYDLTVIHDPGWVGGDPVALDASFWTGIAQLVVLALHNQDYGKVDPGGQAVASLAGTLQDRYVNGNAAQPGLNAILDAWTGNGTAGTTAAVSDEEVNVAAHVQVLEGRPTGAGVDPARLSALLKQLGADLDAAAGDPAL